MMNFENRPIYSGIIIYNNGVSFEFWNASLMTLTARKGPFIISFVAVLVYNLFLQIIGNGLTSIARHTAKITVDHFGDPWLSHAKWSICFLPSKIRAKCLL